MLDVEGADDVDASIQNVEHILIAARVAAERHVGVGKQISDGSDDESPSFSPNGRLIVYATRSGGRDVLMTSTLDGRIKAKLISSLADVREPTWGPFGR